jgi:hypothetical protein
MELTQQEENSMIHVPYPSNQLVHHYIPFQIGDTDTSNEQGSHFIKTKNRDA